MRSIMLKLSSVLPLASFGLAFTQPNAKCPATVLAAVEKAYPESKVSSCMREKEKGQYQYEVKLETKDEKNLEIDASPEGSILLVEENVALDSVPKAVISAFEAKYPKTQANRSEKQTKAGGAVTYELAFKYKGKGHEATFSKDGTFIEVE